MPEVKDQTDGVDESAEVSSAVTSLDEIFFVFTARDEREPHQFIMDDPLYGQGVVKEWHIDELDLIHTERDDELTITGKF